MFKPALPAVVAVALVLAAGVVGDPVQGRQPGAPSGLDKALAAITADGILDHVKALASDEMEGRAPGSPGEDRTVAYLVNQFKAMGLASGNPDGSYVQAVPMMAFTARPRAWLTVKGQRTDLEFPDDYIAMSRQGRTEAAVEDSPIVFAGYGVEAPEYGWDDFKGVDVRGKTLLMLVGDPAVPDPADPARLDPAVFKGPALTYYGRWTCKYEVAARKGASAVILIHETGPAGYGYDVVKAGWGRENFDIDSPENRAGHVAIEGWLTQERARALLAAAGQDFDALKQRAVSRAFTPVALDARISVALTNTIRRVRTRNVIAKLEGSDQALKTEAVMYTAHWDHFGRNTSLEGDQILNGALDNGSGMAELLAMARAFTMLPVRPRRSILFLLPTCEESTMLGAKYYASQPLWPLERTLADINLDIMNFWGRARAIVSIGYGMTTLDDVLAREAARQGRVVKPDPEPEKGYFYRSDHFELAKLGVPALHFLHPGADYRDRPADYGQRMRDAYTAHDYHKVTDEVKPDWDLSGAVEDAQLLFRVGLAVAQDDRWPEWKPGTEFKATREERLKKAPAR